MSQNQKLLTLGEAAERLGAQVWRLRRLIERGLYPEPQRIGQSRVVAESELPRIRELMEQEGYLK